MAAEGTANTTVVYAGGDQTVHGHALDTTLNGGYQYVHNGGTASGTVVNSDGWQIIKEGGLADFTTVNQKGKLQVNAGGTATNVTLKQGGALVTSTAATVLGSNRLGNFTVENGKADGVVLESGGRPDVLEGHSARKHWWMTAVPAVSAGGKATGVTMTSGGALIADSGATVEGPMPAVSSVLMAYPVRPAACCWKMAAALRLMPGTGQQHHCRTSWNTDAGCRGKSEWQNTAQ
ncbi:AIDA repeat-containing protein [Escherichia coli]|uniref:AIDA repeat-containing protein n=1 Tax=Escherichia coli TaxID=562 RepID=UPI003DA10416